MEALNNWREEKRSAYIYRTLSTLEINPVHQKLFLGLAQLAEKQALIWEKQLPTAPPTYHPDLRARIVIKLVQYFGPRALRVALAAMKIRGMSIYHLSGTVTPSVGDHSEHKHSSISQGNNIRAGVFGLNDGLISNTSLLLGLSGAGVNPHMMILTGVAGLLAGAFSMAAGEYVSVRSQREMLEYQLELEKSELELYPEEEAQELALIYEARGLEKSEAEKLAKKLIADPEKALATLAREELGINPDDLMSPLGAALSSFSSFALGAAIPLLPWMTHFSHRLFIMLLLTSITLFGIGATLSLFTQKNPLWSGLRMLCIGASAGLITYWIGGFFRVGNF